MANSNYNGLQISLDKNYSHGLSFQASYTFSKAIDQGASFENELNPINFNATRGVSLRSRRIALFSARFGRCRYRRCRDLRGRRWNGWGVSAIIIYQSGFPIRRGGRERSGIDEQLVL